MNGISDYRRKVDALQAEHRLLGQQLERETERLEGLKQDAEYIEKARALIQQAALQTQETLKIRLTAIVTTALRTVFIDKNLEFSVRFESKRGRTEAVLEVGENDIFTDPIEGHGGGVVDVVSFALRAAFWSISRTRSVLVLDEPFRFLSRDLQSSAAEMIRTLSDKLGLQIIMVSHILVLQEAANLVFEVTREGDVSSVEEIYHAKQRV